MMILVRTVVEWGATSDSLSDLLRNRDIVYSNKSWRPEILLGSLLLQWQHKQRGLQYAQRTNGCIFYDCGQCPSLSQVFSDILSCASLIARLRDFETSRKKVLWSRGLAVVVQHFLPITANYEHFLQTFFGFSNTFRNHRPFLIVYLQSNTYNIQHPEAGI